MIDKEAKLNHIEQIIDKLVKIASNKTLHLHDEIIQVKALKDEYFKIKADLDNAPVTSATKLNVLKRELLATPVTEGYDISADGKKLFNIKGKDSQPMNKKQLEFCSEIELTRNMKKAKLVEKIAHLDAGSTIFIMAEDKAARRVKFASIEHGVRGWCSSSKIQLTALESQPVNHNGHSDKVLGHSGSETLLDCTEGGPMWVSSAELMEGNRPPATPESLNDLESEVTCPKCKGVGIPGHGSCPECGGYATEMKERKTATFEPRTCSSCGKKFDSYSLSQEYCKECRAKEDVKKAAAKECADCHGTFEGAEGETCPTCGRFAVQKTAVNNNLYTPKGTHRVVPKFNIGDMVVFNDGSRKGEEATVALVRATGDTKKYGWTCVLKFNDGTTQEVNENWLDKASNEKQALETALPKQILPQRGDANMTPPPFDPMNGPSDDDVQEMAWVMFKRHWNALGSKEQDEVYKALGVTSSLKAKADMPKEMSVCTKCEAGHHEMCDTDNCICKNSKCVSNEKTAIGQQKYPAGECSDCGYWYPGILDYCTNCGKPNPVKSEKTAEYRMNDEPNECPICFGFGRFLGILGNRKHFKCEQCGQEFSSKNDTKASLKCALCGNEIINGKGVDQKGKPYCKSCAEGKGIYGSLNKVARVVHQKDGWHVLSEKGKNLGGPYKSKGEAVKRLRQVEYFKHNGAIRPFSRNVLAETLANPYQSLTDHITDMRGRMSEVQERIQTAPAIKTAGEEAPMDLPALFEDITHGIALLEEQLGGDESAEHKMIEELENKLWKLEEECGITPKLNEHEKAEPEHKEIVEDIEKEAAGETPVTRCSCGHMWKDHTDDDECSFEDCDCKKFKRSISDKTAAAPEWISYKGIMLPPGFDFDAFKEWSGGNDVDELALTQSEATEFQDEPNISLEFYIQDNYPQFAQEWETKNSETEKHADTATDETSETVVTNDPNATVPSTTPATTAPLIQNVQPTDDNNLESPTQAPTSPLPAGQKWQWDSTVGKYVVMTDPASVNKAI
jgi:hypothetical protein